MERRQKIRFLQLLPSDGLSAEVRFLFNATAELQALKLDFNVVKNCDGDDFIIFTHPLFIVSKLLIATIVIIF